MILQSFSPMGCPLIGVVVEYSLFFLKLLGQGEHMDNFHTYISCNTLLFVHLHILDTLSMRSFLVFTLRDRE